MQAGFFITGHRWSLCLNIGWVQCWCYTCNYKYCIGFQLFQAEAVSSAALKSAKSRVSAAVLEKYREVSNLLLLLSKSIAVTIVSRGLLMLLCHQSTFNLKCESLQNCMSNNYISNLAHEPSL